MVIALRCPNGLTAGQHTRKRPTDALCCIGLSLYRLRLPYKSQFWYFGKLCELHHSLFHFRVSSAYRNTQHCSMYFSAQAMFVLALLRLCRVYMISCHGLPRLRVLRPFAEAWIRQSLFIYSSSISLEHNCI